jgi:hypothetical protein
LVTPRCEFVSPSKIVVRASQTVWFRGCVCHGYGPVVKSHPSFGGLIAWTFGVREYLKEAGLPFDHRVTYVGCGGTDEGDVPAGAGLDLFPDELCPCSCLAEPTACQNHPDSPVTVWGGLLGASPQSPIVQEDFELSCWKRCDEGLTLLEL